MSPCLEVKLSKDPCLKVFLKLTNVSFDSGTAKTFGYSFLRADGSTDKGSSSVSPLEVTFDSVRNCLRLLKYLS